MENISLNGTICCLSSGLLTATGAATTYDTTVALTYQLDGKMYVKATIAGGATPTLDGTTGLAFPPLVGGGSVANTPGKGCAVVWAINAAGVVSAHMGRHEALDMAGAFINAPQFPTITGDKCPFAYQILKAGATASASTVVFGTANWNATGFTNTIQNVFVLPSRPQLA